MSFLTPWMLYALAGLVFPILLHLLRRRQTVELPMSTLRFLKQIAARTRRSAKLENLLLLLLRCLLLALIVLAAARPVIQSKAALFFGANPPRTLVLIIDTSASMGRLHAGRTRLDASKAAATQLLQNLKTGDRVCVIAANDKTQLLLAEPTTDHQAALRSIEEVKLSETRGDFAPALREARKVLARSERGLRQIFLFTDSQQSGWQTIASNPSKVFDGPWLELAPELLLVRPDDLPSPNVCIKEVRIDSPYFAAGVPIKGSVLLENFSSTAFEDLLSITVGSQRVAQKPVAITPNATAEIGFEFPAPFLREAWAKGRVALSGDNLPIDDTYYFAKPAYRPPRALVVESSGIGPERLRPGYFLRKALAAGPDNPILIRNISREQLEETPLEAQTVVFLADIGTLGDRSVYRLERFLEAGGTLVLFGGNSPEAFAQLPFLPCRSAGLRDLPPGRQAVRVAIPEHPLFAGAWDSGAPFPALPQQKVLEWQPSDKAQVLLTIGGRENAAPMPLLIYGGVRNGGVVIVNATADRTWGDLPLSPAFVPLVQQIAKFSSSMGHRQPKHKVGDPLSFPSTLPLNKPIQLVLPGGQEQAVAAQPDRRVLLERTESSGIYEARSGDQSATMAVNLDRAESDLRAMDAEALRKLVPSGLTELVGTDALLQWFTQSRGVVPLWPFVLLAGLVVFTLETLVSNNAARRRIQPSGTIVPTGHLNRRGVSHPGQA